MDSGSTINWNPHSSNRGGNLITCWDIRQGFHCLKMVMCQPTTPHFKTNTAMRLRWVWVHLPFLLLGCWTMVPYRKIKTASVWKEQRHFQGYGHHECQTQIIQCWDQSGEPTNHQTLPLVWATALAWPLAIWGRQLNCALVEIWSFISNKILSFELAVSETKRAD